MPKIKRKREEKKGGGKGRQYGHDGAAQMCVAYAWRVPRRVVMLGWGKREIEILAVTVG